MMKLKIARKKGASVSFSHKDSIRRKGLIHLSTIFPKIYTPPLRKHIVRLTNESKQPEGRLLLPVDMVIPEVPSAWLALTTLSQVC
jgi:hypothetical protein